MRRTLGVLVEREGWADALWNQCDGPGGRLDTDRGSWWVRPGDRDADHVLCIGTPIPPGGLSAVGGRRWGRKPGPRQRAEFAWEWLGVPPHRVTCLFYEPPALVSDDAYAVAREHASRVFGPDERATDPLTLPAMWTVPALGSVLLDESPADKPIQLASVTSGKTMIDGHRARLAFIRRLRAEGVPLELFGHDLPAELRPRGPVIDKSSVLRAARCTLAIENDAACPRYVTEKLWDPILCWSVPLYLGSDAWQGLIPEEAVVVLPDAGAAGVEAVRAALEDEYVLGRRLDALGEARRRVVGALNLTSWLKQEVLDRL